MACVDISFMARTFSGGEEFGLSTSGETDVRHLTEAGFSCTLAFQDTKRATTNCAQKVEL